jgi:hypothetical protein
MQMLQLPLQCHKYQWSVTMPNAMSQLSMECHNAQCAVRTPNALSELPMQYYNAQGRTFVKGCNVYELILEYVPWSQQWERTPPKMIVNPSSLSKHHQTSKGTQVVDLHQDESCQVILKTLGCSTTNSNSMHEIHVPKRWALHMTNQIT